jgi:2-dehydropantoate 2-reductase
LSNKAYHMPDSIESIAPYVSEDTVIIPLLNGVAHMEALWERFGQERVLGGLCFVESTLNADGDVVQTSKIHDTVFGEWDGGKSERVLKIEEAFSGINGRMRASSFIQREVWQKYLYITMVSGITTLMNSSVGPINASPYGAQLVRQLTEEVALVMKSWDAPIDADIVDKQTEMFQNTHASMKSSMLRDMEKGLPVEADHLQGYLLKRASQLDLSTPLLKVVYNNLKVYEQKREAEK